MIGSSFNHSSSKVTGKSKAGVVLVYVGFALLAGFVYHLCAEGEFSSILTLAAIFQCLALSLLALQVSTGNVSGISVKTLQLDVIALCCRLSSTTWLDGYIPSDMTGDYLYQAFDGISAAMGLWIIYQVLFSRRRDYSEEEDNLQASPFVVVCMILASILHPDLNDRPVFDALWLSGLFLGVVSVLPQLWMMARSKNKVSTLTAHFVGVMGFSRMLVGIYMYHGYEEITSEPWFGEFNHAGYTVLGAHILHVMLIGDFIYFYVKNLITNGPEESLELPGAWIV
jgi:hypothetical protein